MPPLAEPLEIAAKILFLERVGAMNPPVLALTQGDPAGIGPEILLRCLRHPAAGLSYRPVLVAESSALEAVRGVVDEGLWHRIRPVTVDEIPRLEPEVFPLLDPVGFPRTVEPGRPTVADARGALAALDAGIGLVRSGVAQALVTAPLNKATIATHLEKDFRGHTDYLARVAGLERYGRDYLMCFLAPDLRVALLTTHLSLREALDAVQKERVLEALRCLHRNLSGGKRIAVAGLNPHAGEGGLMGREDDDEVRPAVEAARREGIDAHGPFSADSLFARVRKGDFDWVLALYHDQGLIAVKTVAFGTAINWTLGLPFLRTSVDHGTAYEIAGQGRADEGPLLAVIERTLEML